MYIEELIKNLPDTEFYIGVPDSQLKPLCDYLMDTYGISDKHIIAANEGNCTAIAAGYHLATGKIPVIYMQNSGIGNAVNPVASLLNEKVYGIPCIFIIGWRGEPGTKDEPQHIYQGAVTEKLLDDIGVAYTVISDTTLPEEFAAQMTDWRHSLGAGKSIAVLVRKNALKYNQNAHPSPCGGWMREDVIRSIVAQAKGDIIVSTTGKTSRELFEIREQNGQSHQYDFLTVGSMGHSSSIALGIALNKPGTRIWCIDGDGAALMHMGALALIGAKAPSNLVHVIINNGAHESVGGQPTVARQIDFQKIALGCGYKEVYRATCSDELENVILQIPRLQGPVLLEVIAAVGSRSNLGRPTTTPTENKNAIMKYLKECR